MPQSHVLDPNRIEKGRSEHLPLFPAGSGLLRGRLQWHAEPAQPVLRVCRTLSLPGWPAFLKEHSLTSTRSLADRALHPQSLGAYRLSLAPSRSLTTATQWRLSKRKPERNINASS